MEGAIFLIQLSNQSHVSFAPLNHVTQLSSPVVWGSVTGLEDSSLGRGEQGGRKTDHSGHGTMLCQLSIQLGFMDRGLRKERWIPPSPSLLDRTLTNGSRRRDPETHTHLGVKLQFFNSQTQGFGTLRFIIDVSFPANLISNDLNPALLVLK